MNFCRKIIGCISSTKSPHFWWIVGIETLLIVLLVSFICVHYIEYENKIDGDKLLSYISYASTLLSVILSIFAIQYTYYSLESTRNQLNDINAVSKQTQKVLGNINSLSEKTKDSLEKINAVGDKLDSNINEILQKITGIEAKQDQLMNPQGGISTTQATNVISSTTNTSLLADAKVGEDVV
ncbi:hypothetical protein [Porphyromonas sp. COT-290 OH3588]|uniref:hypothetical protein n=1 Tax=Porphyromonas sp. COT-290 OH3588 TaxID=1515617 RepID=UPI001269A4B7|nr:hypothetical protein [Porphyromonas sp. COT-290 OH3588]